MNKYIENHEVISKYRRRWHAAGQVSGGARNREENGETLDLFEQIDLILSRASENNDISQYSIDVETLFDSPGFDCGYVSFAYIEEGELFHNTISWERC